MAFAWREAHPNPPTPGAPSFAHFAKGGRPRTPTHRRLKSRSPFLSLPSRKQPSKEAPNNALKNSCEPPIPPPSTAFLAPFRRIAGRLLTFYQAPSHVAPQVDISASFKPRQLPLFLTRPPRLCFTSINVMHHATANTPRLTIVRGDARIPAIRISTHNVRAGN